MSNIIVGDLPEGEHQTLWCIEKRTAYPHSLLLSIPLDRMQAAMRLIYHMSKFELLTTEEYPTAEELPIVVVWAIFPEHINWLKSHGIAYMISSFERIREVQLFTHYISFDFANEIDALYFKLGWS
jgi:hypothetical protein